MKKGDIIWGVILALFVAFVSLEPTHSVFMSFTSAHPYIGGFFKFALLATMGEMLVVRLNLGYFKKAPGIIYRAIIWDFLGIIITLIF